MKSQARYITRSVSAMDALFRLHDGSPVLQAPSDPRTGAIFIELDPVEWIHCITSHVPEPGRHCQGFYSAYSNRGRILLEPGESLAAAAPFGNNSIFLQ